MLVYVTMLNQPGEVIPVADHLVRSYIHLETLVRQLYQKPEADYDLHLHYRRQCTGSSEVYRRSYEAIVRSGLHTMGVKEGESVTYYVCFLPTQQNSQTASGIQQSRPRRGKKHIPDPTLVQSSPKASSNSKDQSGSLAQPAKKPASPPEQIPERTRQLARRSAATSSRKRTHAGDQAPRKRGKPRAQAPSSSGHTGTSSIRDATKTTAPDSLFVTGPRLVVTLKIGRQNCTKLNQTPPPGPSIVDPTLIERAGGYQQSRSGLWQTLFSDSEYEPECEPEDETEPVTTRSRASRVPSRVLSGNTPLEAPYFRPAAPKYCREDPITLNITFLDRVVPDISSQLHWYCSVSVNGLTKIGQLPTFLRECIEDKLVSEPAERLAAAPHLNGLEDAELQIRITDSKTGEERLVVDGGRTMNPRVPLEIFLDNGNSGSARMLKLSVTMGSLGLVRG